MLLIIRKPSWSEARSAAKLLLTCGITMTAKEIMQESAMVAVNECRKVVGVLCQNGSKLNCFALKETIRKAIEKKIA